MLDKKTIKNNFIVCHIMKQTVIDLLLTQNVLALGTFFFMNFLIEESEILLFLKKMVKIL